MEDLRSDEGLLEAVPREPEAFVVFYRRHVSPLIGYFMRRTRDPWRAHARMTEGNEGLQIWAAPRLRCDAPQSADRVCLVLVRGEWNAGVFCPRAEDVQTRGAWFPFPHEEEGRTGVAGLAPAGAAGMAMVMRAGAESVPVPINGGLFGIILSADFGAEPEGGKRIEVRFVDGPDLTVLNGTRTEGLAHEIGARLPGEERLENHVDQQVEHTTVYYGHEDAFSLAEHVAGLLRVDRVEPMPEEIAEVVRSGGLAVVVGRDLGKPRPGDVGVLEAADGISPDTAEALRDRMALGAPLHLVGTSERREQSVVRHAPGWERPAREVAARLGIDALEIVGSVTPDARLGTPIVVVMGSDLVAG